MLDWESCAYAFPWLELLCTPKRPYDPTVTESPQTDYFNGAYVVSLFVEPEGWSIYGRQVHPHPIKE